MPRILSTLRRSCTRSGQPARAGRYKREPPTSPSCFCSQPVGVGGKDACGAVGSACDNFTKFVALLFEQFRGERRPGIEWQIVRRYQPRHGYACLPMHRDIVRSRIASMSFFLRKWVATST